MVLPRQLKIHKFSTDQKKRNKRLSAIGYNLHTNSCSAYGFVLLLGVRSKNKRFCPFFQKVLQKRDLTPLVFARAILAMPGDPFFLNRYLHAKAIKKGTLLVLRQFRNELYFFGPYIYIDGFCNSWYQDFFFVFIIVFVQALNLKECKKKEESNPFI